MRRLDSLREPAAFPGWLATIARNHATDHFRRRGADTVELPDDLAAVPDESQHARAILDAVRSLPDAYGETLILRLIEGMTGPGDRGAYRADGGLGPRQPAPRDEAAPGPPRGEGH